MSARSERILLYGVLPLLILVIGWILVLGPRYDTYRAAQLGLGTAQTSVSGYEKPYAVSTDEQASLRSALPRAADVDGVRTFISALASSANGTVTDLHAAPGGTWDVRLTVPDNQAADLVAQMLSGITRDELLPIARADKDSRTLRVQQLAMIRSQAGIDSISLRITLPTAP
jgi:hypothetical protein